MSLVPTILLVVSLQVQLAVSAYDEQDNTFCKSECGTENTACARAPCELGKQCRNPAKMIKLNKRDRVHIYKLHNKVRNSVAGGSLRNMTAKNMKLISYSLELEFLAQCWANACENKRDACRSTMKYANVGQNVYASENLKLADQVALFDEALGAWQLEFDKIDKNSIESYVHNEDNMAGAQLIWAMVTVFGCGRTRAGKVVLLICNYAPEGLVFSSPIFETGEPCKECKCNKVYKNLCGKSVMIIDNDFVEPFALGKSQKVFADHTLLILPILRTLQINSFLICSLFYWL